MLGFVDANLSHVDRAINSRKLTSLEETHETGDMCAWWPKDCLFRSAQSAGAVEYTNYISAEG